jgi:hypothetical protein
MASSASSPVVLCEVSAEYFMPRPEKDHRLKNVPLTSIME